jgi:AraC family transcriptional regulator of adaptative response/methylated-DNA-[protein]-cysteine methyltransferase
MNGPSPKVNPRKRNKFKVAGNNELASILKSPLGWMLLVTTTRGIRRLAFADQQPSLVEILETFHPECKISGPDSIQTFANVITAWLKQPTNHLEVPLDIAGTDFQKHVWNELGKIPAGQTRTYSEIAKRIGKPRAVRAVASACGANPVALVIPCHRVLGSNGKLCGFRWGLKRKEWLLKHELPLALADLST